MYNLYMNVDKNSVKQINTTINACFSNSENFIKATRKLDQPSMNNIIYHLSVLALEEIGKASLLASQFTVENALPTEREINWGLDDHVKKLFWAFWGASFAKEKITKELIEQYQGLAKTIHQKRLETLYVNPDLEGSTKLTNEEVQNIMNLADARLEMEKKYGGIDLENPNVDKESLKWFLAATNDQEKRKLIFGNKSIQKLEELADSNKWIQWLHEQFKEADIAGQIKTIQELKRKKPGKNEAKNPKWEMTFKLQSESHSLRRKDLDEWNKAIDHIKLFANDKRDLICRIIFPKALHVSSIWEVGLDQSKKFILALNVASTGFIFWKIPRDVDKFYEKVIDLENKTQVVVAPKKKLQLDWKEARLVLDKKVLVRTQEVILYFWRRKKDKEFIDSIMCYYMGLTFLAKTDIHLRLEINAFLEFYQCFKALVSIDHNLTPSDNFKNKAIGIMDSYIENLENFGEIVELGEKLEGMEKGGEDVIVTLTEVIAIKMYNDAYITINAQRKLNKDDK